MKRFRILTRLRALIRRLPTGMKVVLGYTAYMLVGWLLLCLPWAQAADEVHWLDHLFIAVSAVSTTGLVSISPADSYTLFGEFVIIGLIQLGGIGYMTLGSFFVLAIKHQFRQRREAVTRTAFALPEHFNARRFIVGVVIFTLAIEALGAAALYTIFVAAGVEGALWHAIFHAVSAFCTAGFSLNNNSFEGFADNGWLNLTIAVLSYLGAIGFIVMSDAWLAVARRKTHETTLTTRIILRVTALIAVAGTTLVFLLDETLAAFPVAERFYAAFFQVMTAMTTVGFNTVPIQSLTTASIFLIIIAMVVGASPSGTGGGVKSTAVATIMQTVRAQLLGRDVVTIWNHPISAAQQRIAVAGAGFYIGVLAVGGYALLAVEDGDLVTLIFEAASALGTVGLSLGATSSLSDAGKAIVIALMWAGRIGPLTLGMALFSSQRDDDKTLKTPADIAI